MLEEDLLALKAPSKESIAEVLASYHAEVTLPCSAPGEEGP